MLPNADYEESLAWVRRQMDFQRGDAQAQAFAKSNDKGLNELKAEHQQQMNEMRAQNDELAYYLYGTSPEMDAHLDAMRKGKGGKGGKRGKGVGSKFGKGGAQTQQQLQQQQGQQRTPGKGGGKRIKGACWNCGETGHMASDCPKARKGVNELTADEAAARDAAAAAPGGGGDAAAATEAAAAEAWFGSGQAWDLLVGSVSVQPSPPALGDWRPTLRGPTSRNPRSQQQRPQQQLQQELFNGKLPGERWPLPCAAAVNPTRCCPTSSSTSSSSLGSSRSAGPRRRRDWKLLQGVWSETPSKSTSTSPSCSSSSSSALFGLTAPPAVPEGMRVLRVDGTLDSGAEAVVAPRDVIPGPLLASEMSQNGKQYRAANGSRIRNFGQTEAEFRTEEGHMCKLLFQIADVERVLIGVTPLTASGHEVRLGKEGGEILHVATGKTINLKRRGGVFHLPMYFLVPDNDMDQDFPRQGA